MKSLKKVYGVAINDLDYKTHVREWVADPVTGVFTRKLVWCCPFYRAWTGVLRRSLDTKYKEMYPSYADVYVCDEWLAFSNFKAWMESQDWEGNVLDKDLLFYGNKEYSPERCVFIPPIVNLFITERQAKRGEFPIGVHLDKSRGLFSANCSNPLTGKKDRLGRFECPQKAHMAWLNRKLEVARILAKTISDPKAATALVSRYENCGWVKE